MMPIYNQVLLFLSQWLPQQEVLYNRHNYNHHIRHYNLQLNNMSLLQW
jgi:hypothetical protein